MTLSFYTWSEFEKNCGYSRLYGGVNFPDSITNIKALAVQMGRRALDFVRYHVNLQAQSASTNSVNSVRNNGENSYYSFSRERDQLTKNPKTMNYKYYVEYQKKWNRNVVISKLSLKNLFWSTHWVNDHITKKTRGWANKDTVIIINNIFLSTWSTLGFFDKSRLCFSPCLNLGIADFHNGRLEIFQISPKDILPDVEEFVVNQLHCKTKDVQAKASTH